MKTKLKSFTIILLAFVAIATISFTIQPKEGLEVGDKAPELSFNNPDGKEIKLSSLKGKIVLVDFWASWCRPCRKENPTVVKAYQQYKDKTFINGKGFTVYNVSLDVKLERWKKAITADKLEWDNHVSDLKRPAQGAIDYEVRTIPSNFLLDGNGTILAKNLRGDALNKALKKYLKK